MKVIDSRIGKSLGLYLFWIWAVILLLANVLPFGDAINDTNGKGFGIRLDYLFHGFGCLALPLCLLFVNLDRVQKSLLWIYLGLMLTYVVGLELIQIWISYRSFNIMDLLYNIVGVVVGTSVLMWYLRKQRQSHPPKK